MTATTNTVSNTAPNTATAAGRVRATAVVTAIATNSALFLAGRALGADFQITDPGKTTAHQFILPEIAVFTAFFALLGWGSLAFLERVARHPKVVWTMLAATVLVLSYVPIGIEQATPATKAMLALIHTAVAGSLVPMLRGPARRRG
jgi:heme A synthase